MLVSLIVAVSENGVIGGDNQLQWRLPDDLKRFKRLTMGHSMIMGRKTFESIGKPLPGRTSIILTRNTTYRVEGAQVVHSPEEALELARSLGAGEVFVIGGGDIYRQFMDRANRMYLTRVLTVVQGDTFFEIPSPDDWFERWREEHPADQSHAFPFIFIDLDHKP
jgi:dihydrofolate reductase